MKTSTLADYFRKTFRIAAVLTILSAPIFSSDLQAGTCANHVYDSCGRYLYTEYVYCPDVYYTPGYCVYY